MVSLEVASQRPTAVAHVMPIAAPAATGPLAIAWNHIQIQLIDRLGADGLAIARQLAMTTYRSEVDFDERFGRSVEPDDGSAAIQPPAVARVDDSPASRCDDTPDPGLRIGRPELLHSRPLARAEANLALGLEDVRDPPLGGDRKSVV